MTVNGHICSHVTVTGKNSNSNSSSWLSLQFVSPCAGTAVITVSYWDQRLRDVQPSSFRIQPLSLEEKPYLVHGKMLTKRKKLHTWSC